MLPPLVFGTAGHVDHGKTTLVKALTGLDLDSLPEEKERGITISLGFAPLKLPGGRLAGLIDVPGHERLVRTMVAGASGLDAVLLCVSADDGVMPQTREHLQILGLLGVKTGILVVTKVDLVDPELLELAEEEIKEQVRGTFLEGAPVIRTSATTGAGILELLAALDAIHPPERNQKLPFRLPVDRVFARKGFGTVVTGTSWSGFLKDGSEVEIRPGGKRARVRGIQVHKTTCSEAPPGSRVALNLAGLELADVPRGSWVAAPGILKDSFVLDTRYQQLGGVLENETRVLVLLGTQEVVGKLVLLDTERLEPGQSALVQLRLSEPLPCLAGDRFVVRRESPAETLGGGVILDPVAPTVRKAQALEAAATLERMEAHDPEAWLERGGAGGRSEADVVGAGMGMIGIRLGDRYFAGSVVEEHRAFLLERMQAVHREQPLVTGHNRKSLKSGRLLALGDREFAALVEGELKAGRLCGEGHRVWKPGWKVLLSPEQQAWQQQVRGLLEKAGVEGVEKLQLPHSDSEALLALMKEQGEAAAIGDRLVGAGALKKVREAVVGFFKEHTTLDPASFKELFGLSRKTAIPLLEWLDGEGVTRRQGDIRTKG
jgi:selenocysteine-specific elongation factor